MRVSQLLIFILGTAISFECTVNRKIPSALVGTWQARSITIGNIKLDLVSDSLTIPIEYYQERIGITPGSSEYTFDSLVLAELKNGYKNSMMANQVEFTKNGQFKFMPKSGDAPEGRFQLLSRNQIELAASGDSITIKPVFHFEINNKLLHLSQTGDKELYVVYARIK